MSERIRELIEAGLALHRAGRLYAAEVLYQATLQAAPDNVDGLHLLGLIAQQRGDLSRAAELIGRAAELSDASPIDSSQIWGNLARLHLMRGAWDAAAEAAQRAIAVAEAAPEPYRYLGAARRAQRRFAEAAAAYAGAAELQPDNLEAALGLGLCLGEQGRYDEAAAAFARAVELSPADAIALNGLGAAFAELNRLPEAANALRKAVMADPDNRFARRNLAALLPRLGAEDEALRVCREGLRRWPDDAELHNVEGVALTILGEHDAALAAFDRALALDPHFADAHVNRGGALLLRGSFVEAWAEQEWRARRRQDARLQRSFAQPRWAGETLAGKRILLHAEQGAGDTIQLVRFVPEIARHAARVVLEVQPELRRLLQGFAGAEVVVRGDAVPAIDLHCPLHSLPHYLAITEATLPAMPYLAAPADSRARWAAKLGDVSEPRRIGLAWAGNPRHVNDCHRSIPFASLAPLFQLPGIAWFGLQVGERSADAAGSPIRDLAPELHDYAETAAAIAALDLVITVDSSVAHLAGALGRPVWVLLPHSPDPRWMLQRQDSPWYPSARLFRQARLRDWDGVVGRVLEELRGGLGGLAG